mgnify:CR=1 FL=1
MSTYTPTTRQIEDFWASDGIEQPAANSHDRAEGVAEFRRWLEQHDRETAARAWREGWWAGLHDEQTTTDEAPETPNPYKQEEA